MRTLSFIQAAPLLMAATLMLVGCVRGPQAPTVAMGESAAPAVTEANLEERLRRFYQSTPGTPERDALREPILAFYDTASPALINEGDYESVVEHFGRMTALFGPEDFRDNTLPPALRRVAQYIVETGSRPGDEARVMSGLLVLQLTSEDPEIYQAQYQRLTAWSENARESYGQPFRSTEELLRIWQRHATLTPGPEVLERLAALHMQRREAIMQHLAGQGFSLGMAMRMQAQSPLSLRWTPLEIAAIFLTHGDIETARDRVAAMEDEGPTRDQVLRALTEALVASPDGSGDVALLELAEVFTESRPAVANGICRFGLQRRPQNGRFARCLARVAAAASEYEAATGWYSEAIEAEPEQLSFYDEALEKLNQFIERGLFDADIDRARNTARHAEQILRERQRRWPEAEAPIAPEQLPFLLGVLEMRAGNPETASEHLQRSLEISPTVRALTELGTIQSRLGRPQLAVELYWRALDSLSVETLAGATRRCEVLSNLGRAVGLTGNAAQHRRLMTEAISCWTELMPRLEGPAETLALVRRGVLHDLLGAHEEALSDFRSSLMQAPRFRGPYATMLSHLVSHTPRAEFAHEVFRRAMRELSLDPEWKVYFALWVQIVARRAGEQVEDDVLSRLRELSSSATWWGQLARFGSGDLSGQELCDAADTVGERAEAYFYFGAQTLTDGERETATNLLDQVIETGMVGFYEYQMAQELRPSDEDASSSP